MSTFLGFGVININTVRGLTVDLEDRGPSYSYFTPQSVVPGGTNISINCDVQWWGIGPSGDFNVSFRASLNTLITLADPEIVKVLVPSINAGGYADVSWYGTFPIGIANNTYNVGWIIDVDGDVGEDDETNNDIYETSYQLEVVKEAELYDRGVSYSGFTPTEVVPTVTQFNIWCDIENVGLAPSGAFNVSFRASYNPIISVSDFEIAKVLVPSIVNGSFADVSWTGSFPYMPFDSFFVGWVIDVDNDVDEGDENDVGMATFYPLEVFNKSDLADRGPNYSGMSETTVEPGVTAFSVFADIENIGLKETESCNISFYASLDTNITSFDYYVGSEILSSIQNGTFADADWAGIFPNITDGLYYVGWVIDVNDNVDEGNEENNQAHLSTQLIVDGTAPTSLISFTPTAGPYIVSTSTEFNITSDDGSGSGIDEISYRIDGGTWIEYTDSFNLDSYASGNHTIEYFATDNLGNNENIKYIIVYIQLRSDLKDRGANYSGMSETTVEPGVTTFLVWADIENIGFKTSEACNVSFYASLDTIITISDHYLGYVVLLPLLNESYANMSWTGTFPNMTEDTYYIGWLIDVDDDVDEGDEENNQAYILTQLIVETPIPASGGILGYDPFLIIGIFTSISVIFIISKRKKNKL